MVIAVVDIAQGIVNHTTKDAIVESGRILYEDGYIWV